MNFHLNSHVWLVVTLLDSAVVWATGPCCFLQQQPKGSLAYFLGLLFIKVEAGWKQVGLVIGAQSSQFLCLRHLPM